ncbi:hypothetical protein MMAG44476_38100 [Mycolicibacterium mageritense DSM 44476 = CIP 104973]
MGRDRNRSRHVGDPVHHLTPCPSKPPTDERREELAADLRQRAHLVRDHGWEPYETTWSTGEVAGVRAVLGEPDALDAAVEVWAPTLWGISGAEADATTGYERSRRWFRMAAQLESTAPIDLTPPPAGRRSILTTAGRRS